MPVNHKFLNTNFQELYGDFAAGFETHNAILDITPYKPEVLFIGTFNHGWPWNNAYFFYGRNYFWKIFENYSQNNPNGEIQPPIARVFELCSSFKMTFADIVKGTNDLTNTEFNVIDKTVTITNPALPAPFVWKGYSDAQLNSLGGVGCLDDNVTAIIDYICQHPSIKHIYFTWKLDRNWLSGLAGTIKETRCSSGKSFGSILSPSGNGFGDLIPGYPTKLKSIQHAWTWVNNAAGLPDPYYRDGYVHLDHQWLIAHGVNPANF